MSGNQDFASLKKLLTSWNVEILYGLFKEQDISIEELKIIKFRHVSCLLKNYKMGVKIRFEHHLENWRNKIGKPLQSEEQNFVTCNCECKSITSNGQNLEQQINNKLATKRNPIANEMPTERFELLEYSDQAPPQSPQSTKSNSSYHETPANNKMPNLTPIPVLNTFRRQHNRMNLESEETAAETETLTLTHLLAASLDDSHREETTPKYTYKFAPDNTLPVSLAQILQLSGSRGMAIIKYYDENKHLTNTHRTQLIQTIAEFFDDNDYHLSLNMSHNLERQLLKMFPTEKMEYYRTEKRGKIYVKFSNMKRHKRDRNNRPPKGEIDKSHNNSNKNMSGIADNNMDTTSYDTWPEGAEAEIEVKPEVLSDEDI